MCAPLPFDCCHTGESPRPRHVYWQSYLRQAQSTIPEDAEGRRKKDGGGISEPSRSTSACGPHEPHPHPLHPTSYVGRGLLLRLLSLFRPPFRVTRRTRSQLRQCRRSRDLAPSARKSPQRWTFRSKRQDGALTRSGWMHRSRVGALSSGSSIRNVSFAVICHRSSFRPSPLMSASFTKSRYAAYFGRSSKRSQTMLPSAGPRQSVMGDWNDTPSRTGSKPSIASRGGRQTRRKLRTPLHRRS
jgi:hypothetical protein